MRAIKILALIALVFGFGGQGFAQDYEHPLDLFINELSNDIKEGSQASMFRTAETMSNCAAFFSEFSSTAKLSGHLDSQAAAGLQTMEMQIKDVATLMWSLHSKTAFGDIVSMVDDARDSEGGAIRVNGFGSIGFKSRYQECLNVYYVANHLLVEGKSEFPK